MKKFSREILKELKYYVYLISDPNGNVLYVGKGKNNRVFQHFDKKNKSDIAIKIKNLEEKGETAKIEFLVHGIVQETYKILEWFKATSTFSNRIHRSEWQGDRWEFVGNIDLDMRKKYQYNSVAHYWTSGNRNPIRFTY